MSSTPNVLSIAWRRSTFLADNETLAEACPAGSPMSEAGNALSLWGFVAVAIYVVGVCATYKLTKLLRSGTEEWKKITYAPVVSGLFLIPLFFLGMGVGIAATCVDCAMGCGSFSAYTSSISGTVGNLMTMGYVSLYVQCIILPLMFMTQVDAIRKTRLDRLIGEGVPKANYMSVDRITKFCSLKLDYDMWAPLCEVLMIFAAAWMPITGIMPAPAPVCDAWLTEAHPELCTTSKGYAAASLLHTLGINIGVVCMSVFGTIRFLLAASHHPVYTPRTLFTTLPTDSVKVMSWLAVITTWAAPVMFLVWMFGTEQVSLNVASHDLCPNYITRDECVGGRLTDAQMLAFGEDRWNCRWNENAKIGELPCVLHRCNTGERAGHRDMNAKGIVFEYLGFMYHSLGVAMLLILIHQIEQSARAGKTQAPRLSSKVVPDTPLTTSATAD